MPSIEHLIHVYGLWVVAGTIGLESVGVPLPGETALILASVMAGRRHDIDIVAVIVTAGIASTIGRTLGYLIGRVFGYRLLLHYGYYLRINESRIKLGQYLFLKHGGKIVMVAQFLPVLRTIAGILAGANRMPRTPFMLTNIAGAFLWAACFGVAAYSLGREIERLAGPMVVVAAIIAAVLVFGAVAFIKGHETQLEAEAERALPGPLELP
jgi:membrane protein DedA with SNARE-associated domain